MIGAVLAGGLGTRLGAPSKPAALLAGRPLVAYPLEALGPSAEPVAVVCRAGTALPELPAGVLRWDEPDEGSATRRRDRPRPQPRGGAGAGVRGGHAVRHASRSAPTSSGLPPSAPEAAAVVATAGGRLQPLLAVYRPAALAALEGVGDRPLTTVVRGLAPVRRSRCPNARPAR